MAITHSAQRHTAHKCYNAGHIFLEAEETDISSTGRSSGSGSSRYAPSRLAPMAFRASLAHTAAVLSGILTPFPFDPANAGTRRFPDIQFYTMIPQKPDFVKDLFWENWLLLRVLRYHSAFAQSADGNLSGSQSNPVGAPFRRPPPARHRVLSGGRRNAAPTGMGVPRFVIQSQFVRLSWRKTELYLWICCCSELTVERGLFELGVGSEKWEVAVEILRISNKIKSGTDLHRHSQLPTPNFQLPQNPRMAASTKKGSREERLSPAPLSGALAQRPRAIGPCPRGASSSTTACANAPAQPFDMTLSCCSAIRLALTIHDCGACSYYMSAKECFSIPLPSVDILYSNPQRVHL